MQFIFEKQNWEPMAAFFWLKQALDLFLAPAVSEAPLSLNSQHSAQQYDTPTNVPSSVPLSQIIERHREFLSSIANVKLSSFMGPFRELIHVDTDIANCIWLELFPKIWNFGKRQEPNELRKKKIDDMNHSFMFCFVLF